MQAPGKKMETMRIFLNSWRLSLETFLPEDAFQSSDELRIFQATHFPWISDLPQPDLVFELRRDLRSMLLSHDSAVAQSWLATHPVAVMLESDEDGLPFLRFTPLSCPCQLCGELLAIMVEAIELKDWYRLKICLDCQWIFYDTSKNASRLWCSMSGTEERGRACGNIAKARRWRERHRQQKGMGTA